MLILSSEIPVTMNPDLCCHHSHVVEKLTVTLRLTLSQSDSGRNTLKLMKSFLLPALPSEKHLHFLKLQNLLFENYLSVFPLVYHLINSPIGHLLI